jgi:paraquat-inducible protein A
MKTNNLVACAECDALQRETELPAHGIALCNRCGAELYRDKPHSLDHTLAFVMAAAVTFLVANVYPLMGLNAQGLRTTASLLDTAIELIEAGMPSVGILVFATTFAMPLLQLGGLLYLLVPLKLNVVPRHLHYAYRLARWAQSWAMVEVFLLGALISLVRLRQVAEIEFGVGLYAVGAYVLLISAAVSAFEPHCFWRRVEELGEPLPARDEARA